ncbi:MAG TPA: ferritin-like domain-containing protein [Streptosporangiales bacterium]
MSRVVDALQAALAREHEAVYGYGEVGARLSGTDRTTASAYLADHRQARDRLEALIRARHATPVGPRPAYALPLAVQDAHTARALGARIERATAGAYAGLVAAATGSVRREAALAMQDCARRQARWIRTVDALPGLRG